MVVAFVALAVIYDSLLFRNFSNPEAMETLSEYFDYFLENPFSEKQAGKLTKDTMKELAMNLTEIVKQHYTVSDNTKKTLAEKLIEQGGLEGSDAERLAKAIHDKFDKLATEKKQRMLETFIRRDAGT